MEDVNEDTVNNWIEDNADLFGAKPATPQAPEAEINKAQLRQQDILTQGAITPDRAEDIEMRLSNATSADEILNILRTEEQ